MLQLTYQGVARNSSPRFFVRAGWVVVRRGDGQRESIPIYRRRALPIARPRGTR